MKILVIGGGGREHAIIKKLRESDKVIAIYAAPGNGGISKDAVCADIKASDINSMVSFAVENKIDFAVVTPDDPLVLGMVDALSAAGIRCFGPNKAAARIEGSKIFSKNLMRRYGIPTAAYESFADVQSAREYIKAAKYPLWIKTDGLALGKGAIQAEDATSALEILDRVMVDRYFGDSGNSVVIEENMIGPEVTVLAFSDGKTIRPMLSAMDHKRELDGNLGLNTGGMGAIAPNPHYTDEIAARCFDEIFAPTIEAMRAEGCPFKGCLYFGLMITSEGPKVIEYNCRFGDPEAQVMMAMLDSDLLDIMLAVDSQRLADADIRWKPGAAGCIVMASGGYPESYETGKAISGLDESGNIEGACVYHAGTRYENGEFFTSGGRVLGVTASGDTLAVALELAYRAVENISFKKAHYRRDIGKFTI